MTQGIAVTASINPVATRGHQSAPKRNQTGTPRDRRALPAATIDAVRDGTHPKWHGRNLGAAIAASYAQHGHTHTDLTTDLLDPHNGIHRIVRYDDHGRPRTPRAQRRLIDRWWTSATRFIARRPAIRDRADTLHTLHQLRHLAENWTWPPGTGIRQKTILLALIDLGIEQGTLTPTAGYRRLEDLTGISLGAVAANIDRLCGHGRTGTGWVSILSAGRGELGADGRAKAHATKFGFTTPAGVPFPQVGAEPGGAMRAPVSDLNTSPPGVDPPPGGVQIRNGGVGADGSGMVREPARGVDEVWFGRVADRGSGEVRSGLGLYARAVWGALSGVPLSVREVAARAGVSVVTVWRHARVLVRFGLAELVGGGLVRGSAGVGGVASVLGVCRARVFLRARHAVERAVFRELMEEFPQRRGWTRRRRVARFGGGSPLVV